MTKKELEVRKHYAMKIAELNAKIAYLEQVNGQLRAFADAAEKHRMMLIIQLLEKNIKPRVYRSP